MVSEIASSGEYGSGGNLTQSATLASVLDENTTSAIEFEVVFTSF